MEDNELDVGVIFNKYCAGKDFTRDLAHTVEHYEKFSKLGYDVSGSGALYFSDMLDEVRYYYNAGASDEEVRTMIPSIGLDYYHFCHEVSRDTFYGEILDFLDSSNKKKKKKKRSAKKSLPEIDIVERLLYFAKRFNMEEKIENANSVNKQKLKVVGE